MAKTTGSLRLVWGGEGSRGSKLMRELDGMEEGNQWKGLWKRLSFLEQSTFVFKTQLQGHLLGDTPLATLSLTAGSCSCSQSTNDHFSTAPTPPRAGLELSSNAHSHIDLQPFEVRDHFVFISTVSAWHSAWTQIRHGLGTQWMMLIWMYEMEDIKEKA